MNTQTENSTVNNNSVYAPTPVAYTPSPQTKASAEPLPEKSIQIKPKREYTFAESLFAWLSLVAGYLFCRAFPIAENPLGGFLFICLLFAATSVMLKIMGKKFTLMPVIIGISAILIAATLILCSNSFLYFIAYSYSLTAYCYFIYAICENSVKTGFSDFIVADYIKTLFVMPFASFGQMFKAMFSGKAKGSGKTALKILLGIVITIVPTLIVFGLLSYDGRFTEIFNNIFDIDFDDVFSHLGSIILGIPIGLYLYGLFISSVDRKCSQVLCEDGCVKAARRIRIAPVVTVISAVVPLLFIYIVFFISQWEYYISGFTNTLPKDFNYANYAREGFFQLCTVSIINLLIISAVVAFMRRKTKFQSNILKIITVIFSAATLILISTAVAKMVMYIDFYGLTQKRVYATWLMLVIAIVFILIAIRQFVKRLKAVIMSLTVCVVMFAVLTLPNTDAFIAKYNVGRYINGTLETVDIEAMDELGSSAIPSLAELAKLLDEERNTNISKWMPENTEGTLYNNLAAKLYTEAQNIKDSERNIFDFNIPDMLAENALKSLGLL